MNFVKNYVEKEARIIRALCCKEKVSIDVGANQGVLTLFMVKWSRNVLCFEPVPWLADFLRTRFSGCNVSVEECALGNATTQMVLNVPCAQNSRIDTRSTLRNDIELSELGNGIDGIEQIDVSVRRLDDYNLQDVGFIKIDVEGFELEVLKGGRKTLEQNMPNMLIEIEQRFHVRKIYDIFNYIKGMGFCGYFIYENGIKDIEAFDIAVMQKSIMDPAYINNFIFTASPLPQINF